MIYDLPVITKVIQIILFCGLRSCVGGYSGNTSGFGSCSFFFCTRVFLRQRGSVAIPFNQIYGPGLQGGEILSPLLDRPTLLATLAQAGIATSQGDTT